MPITLEAKTPAEELRLNRFFNLAEQFKKDPFDLLGLLVNLVTNEEIEKGMREEFFPRPRRKKSPTTLAQRPLNPSWKEKVAHSPEEALQRLTHEWQGMAALESYLEDLTVLVESGLAEHRKEGLTHQWRLKP